MSEKKSPTVPVLPVIVSYEEIQRRLQAAEARTAELELELQALRQIQGMAQQYVDRVTLDVQGIMGAISRHPDSREIN